MQSELNPGPACPGVLPARRLGVVAPDEHRAEQRHLRRPCYARSTISASVVCGPGPLTISVADGSDVHPRTTLEQYADDWLAHKTNLRLRTRELYEHQLQAHIYQKLGSIELAKLSPKTVREWHAGLTKGSRLGANTAA